VDPLTHAGLRPLLELSRGAPEVRVGLVDGPVDLSHQALSGASLRPVNDQAQQACAGTGSRECLHGTFVAGVLAARRDSGAPAICPGCTLLVRPLFTGPLPGGGVAPERLASALRETVEAGALIINLSLTAAASTGGTGEQALIQALDDCARREVIVIAAAGNSGHIGSSYITRHPAVIPVAAAGHTGAPSDHSNLGGSISQRGVLAPGENIVSLAPHGQYVTMSGTSAAAPIVTGTTALLRSLFPSRRVHEVRDAVVRTAIRRRTIVPPQLNAWAAYQELSS
jgi:subtilisin family serine protease